MNEPAASAAPQPKLQLVFDALPQPFLVLDLCEVRAAFELLRAAGVRDLASHLRVHDTAAAALQSQLRVVDANLAAVAHAGAASLDALRANGRSLSRPPYPAIYSAVLVAAWEDQPVTASEHTYYDEHGRRRTCRLHCAAILHDGRAAWAQVVITLLDSATAGQGTLENVEDHELQAEIFERANLLVWRGRVRRVNGAFLWNLEMPSTQASSRLFPLVAAVERGDLWKRENAPDLPAMEARSSAALASGAPGYQQEFRVVFAGQTTWLAEDVTIRQLGEQEWSLVGVLSDVTARHEIEEANRRNAAHLRNLLERADCMLWQARVTEEDGTYRWELDVPVSGLQRRIFGERGPITYANVTGGGGTSLFGEHTIPEAREKDARGVAALRSGAPGYQNEFRLVTPDHVFWLQEQVTINRHEPGVFDLVGVIFDITDRRAAEDERRRSAAQVRQILERADCMLWHARVRVENGEFRWTFDLPGSGLQSRLFHDMAPVRRSSITIQDVPSIYGGYPVLDQAEMNERSEAAFRQNLRGYEQEFRVQSPGQTYWLHEQVSITEVSAGQWDLVGVVFDVTARRKAEAARRATEERLQQLLTRADCLIWEAHVRAATDQTLVWSFYIPSSNLYRELFGTDPDPVQPRMWDDLKVPEIAQLHARSSQALRTGQPGYVQEFRSVGPERTYWLREQVSIVGQASGHWDLVGVVTDITPRRAAEAALDAEKERLAVTLRAMSEGVVTTDVQGRVQFLNRAAVALTGRQSDVAVGRPVAQVCEFVDARTGAPYELPLHLVLTEGAMLDLPPHTLLRQPGGRSCLIAGRCAPVRDAASAIIGTVLVFADITERQRLDEQLQRTTKLESVGLLAGGIAHDFNNILTAIMGNLSLGLLDVPEDSPAHQNLVDAQSATMRARDLTQQLLTFAKGGEPVRSAVLLPELITEVARFALHGSSVGCEFQLPRDLWSADADRGQFGQIVQNLVINAAQAMSGGGLLCIGAANTEVAPGHRLPVAPGDYVHLTVADNGPGISTENLGRIFDPYFTTKQQGHGLGLATVHSIVRRHGGHIEVESEPGRGTTFHIWLPAVRQAAVRARETPAVETPPLRGRVLFMDDEAPIRKLGSVLLSRLGLEVTIAADGDETIQHFSAARTAGRPFDIVVLDLTVPGGMGGREALAELRRIDPGVRAIVSSGYSSDPVLANFRAFGFCGMVAKPYQLEHFAHVLRDVLASAPAAEA